MITIWQRFPREHPRTVDAVLAAVLLALAIPGAMLNGPNAAIPAARWPALLLTIMAAAVLPQRREHPRGVAILTAACALAVTALGYNPSVMLLAPLMVALFALANRTDRKTANIIAFTAIAAVVPAAVILSPHETIALTVIAPAFCLLLPLALGTTARVRRDYLAAVETRAELAERTREHEARHRVADERVRIARELHDVVAHHLALANAQAGTAAHLVRTRPEQTREILAELTRTTAAALRELKATVGLLRQGDEPDAPLQPAPGLAQLPELTGSFASTGLEVTVSTEGTPQPLSPGVDLTAFRIVQEALTNVAKHSTTKSARLHLAYSAERVTIAVCNDASGGRLPPSGSNTGYGLIGMRERAQAVGGSVHTGPRPEGGYEVVARLPLEPAGPSGPEESQLP